MSIIELKNISKSFKELPLFESINLEIEEGMIHGVIGPNGSGKSVLFKMICGFVFPDQGSIYVNGTKLDANNRFSSELGIIIEKPGYIGGKTGFNNLKDLALIKNLITDKQIIETMKLVGLNPDNKQKVKNYSVGMKQKLAIAQAIMEDQKILILDEPFNGLDEDSVKNIRSLLSSLKRKGKTIVLTSHNKEDINVLCDQVFKIRNKKLEFVNKSDLIINI